MEREEENYSNENEILNRTSSTSNDGIINNQNPIRRAQNTNSNINLVPSSPLNLGSQNPPETIFSSIKKNFRKILILFLIFTAFVIYSHHKTQQDNHAELNLLDSTADALSYYIGHKINSALEDIDYLVYNQRSSSFYEDKYRELQELEYIITQREERDEEEVENLQSNSNISLTNNPNLTKVELDTQIINDSHPQGQSSPSAKPSLYDYKYNLVYEFIKNITFFAYKGKWTDLKLENNIFENIMGQAEVEISKNYSYPFRNNYISNIESIDALYLTAFIKDGYYRDNYLNINMSLALPQNFSYSLYSKLQEKNEKDLKYGQTPADSKINLSYQNISIKFFTGEIFGEYNVTLCNKSNVDIEFLKSDKIFKKSFDNQMVVEYPQLKIQIRDDSCKFSLDMILEANETGDYEERIWNYSLVMTTISIVEIYLTLKLLYDVSDNDQVGKNICLITLAMNIMWNSFICTIHFYLSITNEDFSYEYGTPSMTYFLLFSIFELRLIFFVWRARNHHLAYTDMNLYRKKLLRFYSAFYIFLFIGLLTIRYVFSNFWTCYLFFGSTWFFQIIHSIVNGTKPPYSMNYILIVTIGKLFAPLYIKACPYNIFELKPAFWKMFAITVTLAVQVRNIFNLIKPFLIPYFLNFLF
jgi:hypothetical protein